jgi:uncharacterized protein with HEPN domain
MKHPERIEDYLEHIAQAIERATGYLQPLQDLEALQKNQQVQDAVVRNIEIIGEAVNKIHNLAPDFINRHPELPWARMRGMRNVVIHEYFFVDLKIVWTTVKDDLPRLKQQIDGLLIEQRRGHEQKRGPRPLPMKALAPAEGGGSDPDANMALRRFLVSQWVEPETRREGPKTAGLNVFLRLRLKRHDSYSRGSLPLLMSPAFTFSSGIRFSCRRDREARTSSMSSHSSRCFFRSI